MKVAVAFLFVGVFVVLEARSIQERQLIGICAELCPFDGCPEGTTCRSNGCGHTCQKTLTGVVSLTDCWFGAICNSWCQYGHATDANGCPTCACNPAPVE